MKSQDYYLTRRPALLKRFDQVAPHARPILARHLGIEGEKAEALISEVRIAYADLIPQLPYIGGKQNRLTSNLEESAMFLAIYRVLKQQGISTPEIGDMIYKMTESWYRHYPQFLLHLIGSMQFTPWFRRKLKLGARESQRQRYSEDWIYTYLEGDDKTFDFGVDYTQCGICKFFHAQGADDYTPYLCRLDYATSKAFGFGMQRTGTLGEGAARCDFRLKRGRETPGPPASSSHHITESENQSTSPSTAFDPFDEFYAKVPAEQREQLRNFRSTHPLKQLEANGHSWSYISCGPRQEPGDKCLVLLPGGLQISEPFFQLILALETEYQIIAPYYPPVNHISELVDGLKAVLDTEGVKQIYLLGSSLGGMLAQCFVRKYPERVSKLMLSDTTVPNTSYASKLKWISRIIKLIPLPLLKLLARRRFEAYMSVVPASERAFWQAYFIEYVAKEWTRARITNQYKLINSFGMDYSFAPADLAKWPGALLIVEAEDDQAINPHLRAALRAAYPQAQVYTFQGGGHVVGITRREEYMGVIREFLKEKEESIRISEKLKSPKCRPVP